MQTMRFDVQVTEVLIGASIKTLNMFNRAHDGSHERRSYVKLIVLTDGLWACGSRHSKKTSSSQLIYEMDPTGGQSLQTLLNSDLHPSPSTSKEVYSPEPALTKRRNLINTILPETVNTPHPSIREPIRPPARIHRPIRVQDAEIVRAAAGQAELHAVGQREEAAVEVAWVLAVGAWEGVLAGVLAVDPGRVVLVVGVVVVVRYADLDGGEAGGEVGEEEGGGGGFHLWGSMGGFRGCCGRRRDVWLLFLFV